MHRVYKYICTFDIENLRYLFALESNGIRHTDTYTSARAHTHKHIDTPHMPQPFIRTTHQGSTNLTAERNPVHIHKHPFILACNCSAQQQHRLPKKCKINISEL